MSIHALWYHIPMAETDGLPETFSITFSRPDSRTYRLSASQVLPVAQAKASSFFEDPRNLSEITPDWLDFRMLDRSKAEVFEGAEFDYTIRWLSLRLFWRSRIVGYQPPESFTDVQVKGPYPYWSHLHTFAEQDGSTLMKDEVIYRLSFGPFGRLLHQLIIRQQLRNIFRYRAVRIAQWAAGDFKKKV
jgi:ligand-binding SRPBCC domain-containing protein